MEIVSPTEGKQFPIVTDNDSLYFSRSMSPRLVHPASTGFANCIVSGSHSTITDESAATPVHAFVTSRIDYCDALYAGSPKTITCNECSTLLPMSSVTHGSLTVVCPHFSTMSFTGWTTGRARKNYLQAGRHGVSLSARSSTSVPRRPSHSSL